MRSLSWFMVHAKPAERLQLHVLAYNLGNFLRTLVMPKTTEPWSLTGTRGISFQCGFDRLR